MKIKEMLDAVLVYIAGVLLGFIISLFIFLLEATDNAGDITVYFWLVEKSRTHILVVMLSSIFGGLAAASIILSRKKIKDQGFKINALEEISKNKTELISFITHHVRTPISALKFSVKMFLDGDFGRYNKEQKQVLNNIYSRVQKLVSVTRDLLDISKLEIGRSEISLRKINLAELERYIKKIISEVKPLAEESNIKLYFSSFLNPALFICVDLIKINQIVDNLLENAIIYSSSKKPVHIIVRNDDKEFQCSVADSGIGIPLEERSKIFTKFYRAKNSIETISAGMGIGLYLCKEAVIAHRGNIWFESEENKGTTFYFSIPLEIEKPEEFFGRI